MEFVNCITEKEKEILCLLAKGYKKMQIAEHLGISDSTVKTHVENIYMKLNVHNKIQAIVYCLKNNILDLYEI